MLLQNEKWNGIWPEGHSAPSCVRHIDAEQITPHERPNRRKRAQKRPDSPYRRIQRGDVDHGSVREGR
jgi:hypothetical protein